LPCDSHATKRRVEIKLHAFIITADLIPVPTEEETGWMPEPIFAL
jgi:hypothetical protein